jgi:hypothetical protein
MLGDWLVMKTSLTDLVYVLNIVLRMIGHEMYNLFPCGLCCSQVTTRRLAPSLSVTSARCTLLSCNSITENNISDEGLEEIIKGLKDNTTTWVSIWLM